MEALATALPALGEAWGLILQPVVLGYLVLGVVMGLAAVCTLPLYRVAVLAIGTVFQEGERIEPYWYAFNAIRYLSSVVIMLPATFCAGMTLPLLTHVLLRRGQSEAAVGQVYALNTLGAIVGAVSGGLLFLPLVGSRRPWSSDLRDPSPSPSRT